MAKNEKTTRMLELLTTGIHEAMLKYTREELLNMRVGTWRKVFEKVVVGELYTSKHVVTMHVPSDKLCPIYFKARITSTPMGRPGLTKGVAILDSRCLNDT